jgi:hypothetical protein
LYELAAKCQLLRDNLVSPIPLGLDDFCHGLGTPALSDGIGEFLSAEGRMQLFLNDDELKEAVRFWLIERGFVVNEVHVDSETSQVDADVTCPAQLEEQA